MAVDLGLLCLLNDEEEHEPPRCCRGFGERGGERPPLPKLPLRAAGALCCLLYVALVVYLEEFGVIEAVLVGERLEALTFLELLRLLFLMWVVVLLLFLFFLAGFGF
jgi:hypothetical protein